jgi:hypothetical protein
MLSLTSPAVIVAKDDVKDAIAIASSGNPSFSLSSSLLGELLSPTFGLEITKEVVFMSISHVR